MKWQDHIVSTPDTLHGRPRIRETRIPVSLILGYLAAGNSTMRLSLNYRTSQANISRPAWASRDAKGVVMV